MTLPLWILAALSVVGGVALGLPPVFHVPHLLHAWLHPVVAPGEEMLGAHHLSHAVEWVLLALGAGVALFFAHKGFHAYRAGPAPDERFERARPGLVAFLRDAWRVDTSYTERIVLPVKLLAFGIAVLIDQLVIDGLVNGAGRAASALGQRMRAASDGDIKSYAVWIGAGTAALALVWMWV
jgi:NADH-quinone oxidoreductase subunit L